MLAQLPNGAAAPPPNEARESRDWGLETGGSGKQSPVSTLQPPIPSRDERLWIGAVEGMERALVERAGIPFAGIETGQVRGINPVTALVNGVRMVTGIRQSLALIKQFRPDVGFVTGGYVCAPVVVACRLRNIPVLIYLPDLVPGWAIRTLSYLAQRVAVTMPAATRYFGGEAPRGKAIVTGYPVRQDLLSATGGGRLDAAAHAHNRQEVRRQLAEQLQRPLNEPGDDGAPLPLLLVWGGSQGARNINRCTWAALEKLLPHVHLLHVVGERDWPLLAAEAPLGQLPAAPRNRYHPVPYLHGEMALALAAADLTVARAGASTLGEFTVARLPSVLVPLLGVNQLQNAEALAQQGGAVIIADDALSAQLAETVLALVRDPARRQQMEAALARLAQPEAAQNIAAALARLGQ